MRVLTKFSVHGTVCSGGLRKPRVVIWMTCTFHVNGHILPKFPPFFTVIVRRVHLPRTWSTMLVIPGCAINQPRIDVEEVDPNIVVAALICFPDAKRVLGDCDGTMHTNVPLVVGSRWFNEPTCISPPGTSPGSHKGVGPGGIGMHVLASTLAHSSAPS